MRHASRLVFFIATATALNACAQPAQAPASVASVQSHEAASTTSRIQTIASGLEHPWAVALLPEGGFLVSERPGRLRRIAADGSVSAPLSGLPAVFAQGQGGLLDVVLDPQYPANKRIWFTYAEPGEGGSAGTAAATATLAGDALVDLQVIYRQQPKLEGGLHFGSRLAFDGNGHVFISQGERGQKGMAQDLGVLQGKLVRLNLDGSIPADNPYARRADARGEIWSLGHRNMQGMAVDPRNGRLWQSEHGPRGGDELNLPQAGKNYGWPVASDGMDYGSNRPYPETKGREAPGMERPHHAWAVSPALSGMAFYGGRPGNAWNDSLFLGALAGRSLIRLQLDGDRIVAEERLLVDLGKRIRDVRVGADGAVYVLTDEADGQLLRLQPPSGTP